MGRHDPDIYDFWVFQYHIPKIQVIVKDAPSSL